MAENRTIGKGLALGVLILVGWTMLHIATVFFLPIRFSLPLSLLAVAVLTWLSVGLFIVAHDAMHGSLAPSHRRTGNIIGAVCLMFYANFSFSRLLPKHHAHHHDPGSQDDPDFHPDHPRSFGRWYGRFMRTYFGAREFFWMSLRVAVYLLLGARMENILLFFALPGMLSSIQLFYFGTFLPHRHTEQAHDDHHRARSNDYPIWLSLLTCFHFGYHHEHHLSPGTPWWQLPHNRQKQCESDVAQPIR